MTRKTLHPSVPRPELDALLEAAKNHKMPLTCEQLLDRAKMFQRMREALLCFAQDTADIDPDWIDAASIDDLREEIHKTREAAEKAVIAVTLDGGAETQSDTRNEFQTKKEGCPKAARV